MSFSRGSATGKGSRSGERSCNGEGWPSEASPGADGFGRCEHRPLRKMGWRPSKVRRRRRLPQRGVRRGGPPCPPVAVQALPLCRAPRRAGTGPRPYGEGGPSKVRRRRRLPQRGCVGEGHRALPSPFRHHPRCRGRGAGPVVFGRSAIGRYGRFAVGDGSHNSGMERPAVGRPGGAVPGRSFSADRRSAATEGSPPVAAPTTGVRSGLPSAGRGARCLPVGFGRSPSVEAREGSPQGKRDRPLRKIRRRRRLPRRRCVAACRWQAGGRGGGPVVFGRSPSVEAREGSPQGKRNRPLRKVRRRRRLPQRR